MINLLIRNLSTALAIVFLSVVFPSYVSACMIFGSPDSAYWSEHATSIVDATVYGFDQKPLTLVGQQETGTEYPDPWVLELRVHRTLRGDALDFREIATRVLNTTIVDKAYIANLVGQRSEFAILDVPYTNFSGDIASLPQFDFPPRNGAHVLDVNGEATDEIWELVCTALPIFDIGTFAD